MNRLPNILDFKEEIQVIKKDARNRGERWIEIQSGELHKKVGGYPGQNHRMATCCAAMYSLKTPKDEIISAPPKGKGATLRIRYFLDN